MLVTLSGIVTLVRLVQEPNVRSNLFGFRVSWATNRASVAEGCTNLASGPWLPLATNSGGSAGYWFYFSDPD